MANTIHMILDSQGTPLDISDYIMQQTDIVETPVYTEGPAAGVSKMGTPIYDRLQTLYAFTVPLKPDVQGVYELIEAKVKTGPFYVTYTSYRGSSDVELFGQVTMNAARYVMVTDRNGSPERVYAGPSISFTGYERS